MERLNILKEAEKALEGMKNGQEKIHHLGGRQMILTITVICYIILAASLIVPFRISSAESRREEREVRK